MFQIAITHSRYLRRYERVKLKNVIFRENLTFDLTWVKCWHRTKKSAIARSRKDASTFFSRSSTTIRGRSPVGGGVVPIPPPLAKVAKYGKRARKHDPLLPCGQWVGSFHSEIDYDRCSRVTHACSLNQVLLDARCGLFLELATRTHVDLSVRLLTWSADQDHFPVQGHVQHLTVTGTALGRPIRNTQTYGCFMCAECAFMYYVLGWDAGCDRLYCLYDTRLDGVVRGFPACVADLCV